MCHDIQYELSFRQHWLPLHRFNEMPNLPHQILELPLLAP